MILKHIHKSDRWPEFKTGCKSEEDCVRLVRYLFRQSANPTILRNDFAGDTPLDIGRELADMHQGQKLWAYHIVASYPKGEASLWEPQARRRIAEVQERCGVSQSLWVSHNGHWHGFLLAMKPQGGTVRLGTYNERGEPVPVAMAFREMAQRWEDETPRCQKTGRGDRNLDLTRDSIAAAERQYLAKEAPTPIPKKLLLKAEIDRIVTLSDSFDALHAAARDAQISVIYRRDEKGNVLGLSFSKDGVALRGREAGHSYPALQKLYGNTANTPTTNFGRSYCVAERNIGPHRRQGDVPAHPRGAAPDEDSGIHSRLASQPRRPEPSRVEWLEKAVRALSPREVTLMDFLMDLSVTLTRIVNQNDYRRTYHRPLNPPSL